MMPSLGFCWWERGDSRKIKLGVENCWCQWGRKLVEIVGFYVYILR